ncbi:MAG: PQQ-binding-like beta-propeller repeat protein [Planctomycetota bacterium]
MTIKQLSLVPFFILWCLICFGSSSLAVGKQEKPTPKQDDQDDVKADSNTKVFSRLENTTFINAPRELTRPLIRARRAIQENEPARAAELIGQFLIESPPEDYLIAGENKENRSTSLRLFAESMLTSLSSEALKSYRLRYGIPARHLLDRAIETRDYDGIADVANRYFLTDAGQTASMIMGHYHLDGGNPVSAVQSFLKIYDLESARQRFEPELSVLLATSYSMMGSDESADFILVDLKKRMRLESIRFDNRDVALFADDQTAITWLKKLIGDTDLRTSPLVTQWLMPGGNPQRNARVESGLPFQQPIWSIKFDDPINKFTSSNLRSVTVGSGFANTIPLAVGDTIVVNSNKRTFGVDFRTGKRQWMLPFADVAEPTVMEISLLLSSQMIRTAVNANGAAASDGERLFLIPKLERGNTPTGVVYGRYTMAPDSKSQLAMLDLRRQGKLDWLIGNDSDDNSNAQPDDSSDSGNSDRSVLESAKFLGSPLPVGDELYAICKLNQATQLVVIDRNSGKLKWKQPLASNEIATNNRYTRSNQNQLPLTPSFYRGVVVCPTGTGAIVAIDSTSRTFLWGHQYHKATRYSSRSSSSWKDAKLIIDNDHVLYAAPENNRLIQINLGTGIAKTESGSDAMGAIYLACVEDNRAILIGKTKIYGISLEDEKERWSCSIEDFGEPSGEGFTADGHYYLPTDQRYVLKIDLTQGEIVDHVETEAVLGNLIAYRGTVISVNQSEAACFETDATASRMIAEAMEQYPSEADLPAEIHIKRSRLFARNQQWQKALKALSLAADKNQQLADLQVERVGLIEQMLDSDADGAREVIDQYWSTLTESDQKRLYPSLIASLIRSGQPREAAKRLIEWAQQQEANRQFIDPDQSQTAIVPEFLVEQSFRTYDADVVLPKGFVVTARDRIQLTKEQWFRAKLGGILASNADRTQEIQDLVRQQYESKSFETPVKAHRFLQRFPAAAIPVDISVELAERLIEIDEVTRAKQLLLAAIGFDPAKQTADEKRQCSNTALRAWFQYADRIGARLTIQFVVGLIETESLNVVETTGEGISAVKFLDQVETFVSGDRATTGQPSSSMLTTVTNIERSSNNNFTSNSFLRVLKDDRRFSLLEDYTFAAHRTTKELLAFDGLGNLIRKMTFQAVVSTSSRDQCSIDHNETLMVFKRGKFVALVDQHKMETSGQQPVLWETSLTPLSNQAQRSNLRNLKEFELERTDTGLRQLVGTVSVNGICIADRTALKCFDAFTGQLKWRRPIKSRYPVVFGDDVHMVLVDFDRRIAEVYEIETGRRTKIMELPERIIGVWDNDGAQAITVGLVTETRLKELKNGADEDRGGTKRSASSVPRGSRLVVGKYDFLKEEFVWVKNLLPDTKASRMSNRRFAAVPATGNVKIFDLFSGEKLKQLEMDWEGSDASKVKLVGSVPVNRDLELLVFHTSSSTLSSLSAANYISVQKVVSNEVLISGAVMMLDRKTMEPVWQRKGQLTGFSLMPFVPVRSPLLFFHRRVTGTSSAKNPLRRSHQILGIDPYSGLQRVNQVDANSSLVYASMMVFDEKENVLAQDFGSSKLRIQLGEQLELPPSPVVNVDRSNPIPPVEPQSMLPTFDERLVLQSIKRLEQQAIEEADEVERLRQQEKQKLKAEFETGER